MDKNVFKICLLIFMIFISKKLFSQTLGNNNRLGFIVNDVIENKSIVLISQMDNLILYSDVNSYNLYLYNKISKINKEIIINEINIYSARLIKHINIIIAEIIGSTNMGNGDLYLFDADSNILLERYYVDGHMEREFVFGEIISKTFRNYTLNIDYNFNGKNIIRIYGIRDYILEVGESHKIILSEDIDEKYIYSNEDKKFVLIQNTNK